MRKWRDRRRGRWIGIEGHKRRAARSPRRRGNAALSARLRKKLLERLDRMADELPQGAVTEMKQQAEDTVKLFKLRDLTAAYRDLAEDGTAEGDVEDLSPVEELFRE